jgi:hypothetical protein
LKVQSIEFFIVVAVVIFAIGIVSSKESTQTHSNSDINEEPVGKVLIEVPLDISTSNFTEDLETNKLLNTVNTVNTAKKPFKLDDPLLEEYKTNSNCFASFTLNSEEKIDEFLNHMANISLSYTFDLVQDMKKDMLQRAEDCAIIVDNRTEEEFYQYTYNLLNISAEEGSSEAKLMLSSNLDWLSLRVGRYSYEGQELYHRSTNLLQQSALDDPQAKILLALRHLDNIYHPEMFDINKAKNLVKEAQLITGYDYEKVKQQIKNLQ